MSLTGTRVVVREPGRVELEEFEVAPPGPQEVLFRTEATLISPGTETAKYTGLQQVPPDFIPGYASCGTVIEVGAQVKDVAVGDRIFSYSQHASVERSRTLYAKVPDGVASEHAPFARLAAVALTSLRVSDIELGDAVAVIGLGLVGNFAAQLFTLAGAETIGLDLSPRRRAIATECGLPTVVDPGDDGGVGQVRALTGGQGVACCVEAVGYPPLVHPACAMTAKRGEVIWVGSPRGEYQGDITAVLDQVHLWGNGCLTFKGAHEWRTPVRPVDGLKHSLTSHAHCLLKLIADGRLRVAPLHTQTIRPEGVQAAYEALLHEKDQTLGVVIDWR